MDAFLFDPKETIIENLEKPKKETPISLYLVIIASIAMFYVLYQKSQIDIINPFYLVVDQIKSWVLSFSFNKPVINNHSIHVIRYSYELPKSLDFLFH